MTNSSSFYWPPSLSILPRDIRWCEWMNVNTFIYVYIFMCVHVYALFTSRSLFLILTKLIRGKCRKKKKKKRKQSSQSNKFKLLSTINRSSFVRLEYKRISTFHIFFLHLNNEEVLFIKVNWPSSRTYSQTPCHTINNINELLTWSIWHHIAKISSSILLQFKWLIS